MWLRLYTSCLTLKRFQCITKSVYLHRSFSFMPRYRHFNEKVIRKDFLIQNCFRKSISSDRKVKPKKELWQLIKIAEPEKYRLAGAIFFLLISSSVTMAVPFCLGKIIDMLNLPPEELKTKMTKFCKLVILVLAVGAFANFGRVYLINMSSYRIINDLRRKAYNSILTQEVAFFDKMKTGELMSRISNDASIVGLSVTNNISDGLRSFFSLTAGSSLMIYTSPYLAFVGLMTVSPVAVFAVIYGRFLKKVTQSVQDAIAKATEVAEERIANIRMVQAFAQVKKEQDLFRSKINEVLQFASQESLSRAVFFGLSGFSGNLIALAVLYTGGFMATDNLISVGNLASFLMYAAYVGISIGGLSGFYAELMRGVGASSKLFELIDRQSAIPLQDGKTLTDFKGNVLFNAVTFAYPSRYDVPILNNFSLNIPSGSVYAIVGPSGSGKSTLGALLLRFYDCNSGAVIVDGHDIKTLNLHWLRENIGIVSQDPVLFSCSIKDNIAYGLSSQTKEHDELLSKVAEEANALEFISKFPQGFDTLVGERGVMLSGGQKQRISIARALLKNPKILILDEATSALDAESEYLVQSALETLMKGRTVITIAHRLSTVRKADRIAVLDDGQIVEEGKYDELLQVKGIFYRLVQRQSIKS